ncbi:MAG: hypothetical protein AVDCRST_MAG22-1424, partial [uncultured Rubrobacteraceae bacterium]
TADPGARVPPLLRAPDLRPGLVRGARGFAAGARSGRGGGPLRLAGLRDVLANTASRRRPRDRGI